MIADWDTTTRVIMFTLSCFVGLYARYNNRSFWLWTIIAYTVTPVFGALIAFIVFTGVEKAFDTKKNAKTLAEFIGIIIEILIMLLSWFFYILGRLFSR